jgi:hypothetical protein
MVTRPVLRGTTVDCPTATSNSVLASREPLHSTVIARLLGRDSTAVNRARATDPDGPSATSGSPVSRSIGSFTGPERPVEVREKATSATYAPPVADRLVSNSTRRTSRKLIPSSRDSGTRTVRS